MNDADALKEAQRRWGPDAFAICGYGQCAVGKGRSNRGIGSTFELAFADADRRKAGSA
jgi:hypothetical protein